jgi:hypothetical protein
LIFYFTALFRSSVGVRVTSVRKTAVVLIAATLWLAASIARAQIPSFSGAEGFGGTFTGSAPAGGWFSNASVYHVTTTADTLDGSGKPVQGTLRGAFFDYTNPSSPKQQASNRIVVFDVGGTFNISAAKLDIKTVNNIYIAGQTAPSPVTVYGNMAQITKSNNTLTSNLILRYMSFRKGAGPEQDALSFVGGNGAAGETIAHNMILDHVTASWSEDENISVTNNNTDVTVQYSIIHDALVSDHAYGSLIRPKVDSNVSFHHNLYANNASRQARFGTYLEQTLTADFRNNVVYNFRDRASYAGGSDEGDDAVQEYADVNYVGNYIVAGPGTGTVPANFAGPGIAFSVDKNITARVHQYGNMIDSNGPASLGSADGTGKYNGADTGWGMFKVSTPITDQSLTHMNTTQFSTSPVTTQSAVAAYNQVLGYAGNYWWSRDVIDSRVVNNVRDYTGPSLAASAPIASELSAVTGATTTSRAAVWDTDSDGMPNVWETAHGLNPSLNTDFKLDADGDGYVNLQEYLDEVGAFPAPTPLTYVGAASGSTARYALITNWKTAELVETVPAPAPAIIHAGSNWQPSRFDEVQISSGVVTVDAAGQHAGILRIGGAPANNAALVVSSGWLKVENDTVIGGSGVIGDLNLTGGTLSTKTLNKLSGSFNFTGGKLSADTVGFSFTNYGGTLAPGDSIGDTQSNAAPVNIGETHVVGDLSLNSGSLQIELASLASFDKLLVDGAATLGGSLNVSTLGGFVPTNGSSWQIIAAGSISGQFSSITPGYSVQQQGNNLLLLFGTPTLAGDYDADGAVTARDYVVWRKSMNNGGTLPNETASPGTTDQADYDAWRANFGATSGGGDSAGAVPEPTPAVLFLLGIGGIYVLRNSGSFLQE